MIMFTVCKQLGLRLLNPDLQSSPRKWLIRRVVALPTSFVVVLTAKNDHRRTDTFIGRSEIQQGTGATFTF